MKNHVLYFNKPHEIIVQEESVPLISEDEVLIENRVSGISAGTELLLYKGLFPSDIILDENIPSLNKTISYPCKYGYCSVGKVIETGSKKLNHLLDRRVFVFHPHQSYFCIKEEQILLLPDSISNEDALFIPHMETAVNLIQDGAPLIGENVLVLGLGILGLLTTALLEQFPLSIVLGVDLYEKRRQLALELGTQYSFDASIENLDVEIENYLDHQKIDLVYELSGNPQALNCAITHASFEGRIVLASWYGKKSSAIDLGNRFHRNRIQLIASQVSTIASKLQGRWSKQRRFDTVFRMLETIKPSRFISHCFPVTEADKAYQLLDANPGDTLLVTLNYEVS